MRPVPRLQKSLEIKTLPSSKLKQTLSSPEPYQRLWPHLLLPLLLLQWRRRRLSTTSQPFPTMVVFQPHPHFQLRRANSPKLTRFNSLPAHHSVPPSRRGEEELTATTSMEKATAVVKTSWKPPEVATVCGCQLSAPPVSSSSLASSATAQTARRWSGCFEMFTFRPPRKPPPPSLPLTVLRPLPGLNSRSRNPMRYFRRRERDCLTRCRLHRYWCKQRKEEAKWTMFSIPKN